MTSSQHAAKPLGDGRGPRTPRATAAGWQRVPTAGAAAMDAVLLFEHYTVDEVRQMEKKTRQDIEKKKEDLRQMVGERYRDLIDAADTVGEMKQLADSVSKALAAMQTHCRLLKDLHMIKGVVRRDVDATTRPNKEKSEVYSMACQMRLLLTIPEMVWAALDCGAILEAAQLYLLARHVYTLLQLDPRMASSSTGSSASATVAAAVGASGSAFPLVSKQWTAISHFKGTILEASRTFLKATEATDQEIADALCCIILLEEKTTRQAFHELLVARSYTVQQQQPQQTSVKKLACRVVVNVRSTVRQIHSVFYPGDASARSGDVAAVIGVPSGSSSSATVAFGDLLMATLTRVTSCSGETLLFSCTRRGDDHLALLKHLPSTVTEFRPMLLVPPSSLSVAFLHDNCSKWLDTCLQNLRSGITSLLGFVGSAGALASVRDAVWEALDESNCRTACSATPHIAGRHQQTPQASAASSWDVVCGCLFGRSLDLWRDVLAPLFVGRIKDLIESQLSVIQKSCEECVRRSIDTLHSTDEVGKTSTGQQSGGFASTQQQPTNSAFERDSQTFVWTEHASDIGPGIAWTPSASQTFADSGGLKMKAHGLTPAVQSVAKQYDFMVDVLAKDIQSYTQWCDSSDTDAAKSDAALAASASNRSDCEAAYLQADSSAVEACLSVACCEQAKKLISFIGSVLNAEAELLRTQTKAIGTNVAVKVGKRPEAVDRILLLARLCCGLGNLCPSLKKCVALAPAVECSAASSVGSAAAASSLTARTAVGKQSSSSWAAGHSMLQQAPKWVEIMQLLRALSDRAYSAWSDYVLSTLLHGLNASLRAQHSSDFGERLQHVTRWDEIDIQEESEEGREVKSTIAVPMQTSAFIQELIYGLCQEIARAGGHNLKRAVLRQLVSRFASQLLRLYEELQQKQPQQKPHDSREMQEQKQLQSDGAAGLCTGESSSGSGVLITQPSALQSLFDVFYLRALLLWKGEPAESTALEKQFSSVVDGLQTKVDPFDLDVFMPHLQRHVHRQCQRSMVLFGTVSDAERLSSTALSSASSSKSTSGHSDVPNLLPLGGSGTSFGHITGGSGAAGGSLGRFPLLPVAAANVSSGSSLQPQSRAASGVTSNSGTGTNTSDGGGGRRTGVAKGFKENVVPSLRHSATEPSLKVVAPSLYDKLGSMFSGGGSAAGGGSGKGN